MTKGKKTWVNSIKKERHRRKQKRKTGWNKGKREKGGKGKKEKRENCLSRAWKSLNPTIRDSTFCRGAVRPWLALRGGSPFSRKHPGVCSAQLVEAQDEDGEETDSFESHEASDDEYIEVVALMTTAKQRRAES